MFSFASFSPEKQVNRDTRLTAILRRQYGIILTALEQNIFRIGLSRFATPPNTESSDRRLGPFQTSLRAESTEVLPGSH